MLLACSCSQVLIRPARASDIPALIQIYEQVNTWIIFIVQCIYSIVYVCMVYSVCIYGI